MMCICNQVQGPSILCWAHLHSFCNFPRVFELFLDLPRHFLHCWYLNKGYTSIPPGNFNGEHDEKPEDFWSTGTICHLKLGMTQAGILATLIWHHEECMWHVRIRWLRLEEGYSLPAIRNGSGLRGRADISHVYIAPFKNVSVSWKQWCLCHLLPHAQFGSKSRCRWWRWFCRLIVILLSIACCQKRAWLLIWSTLI